MGDHLPLKVQIFVKNWVNVIDFKPYVVAAILFAFSNLDQPVKLLCFVSSLESHLGNSRLTLGIPVTSFYHPRLSLGISVTAFCPSANMFPEKGLPSLIFNDNLSPI